MFARLARATCALAILAATTLAGDCFSGNACCNACPLAKQANTRMSTGNEAAAVSSTLRADLVSRILADLEAI